MQSRRAFLKLAAAVPVVVPKGPDFDYTAAATDRRVRDTIAAVRKRLEDRHLTFEPLRKPSQPHDYVALPDVEHCLNLIEASLTGPVKV